MRRIEAYPLWLGHVGDLRAPKELLDAGIRAVVDLASNEPIPSLPRDLTYCRFPLFDGSGNDPALLRLTIRTVAELLRTQVPTIVCCSVGLSRSLAVAAAAIHVVTNEPLEEALRHVAADGKHDLSPGLWQEVTQVCAATRASRGA